MRGVWGVGTAAVVVLLGMGVLIGFASRPPARVWNFQYKVVGTDEWRDWRLYPNSHECGSARRATKNLSDGQKRPLVQTRPHGEREHPPPNEQPSPPPPPRSAPPPAG